MTATLDHAITSPPAANGSHGPRAVRRIMEVDIADQESYPGFRIAVHQNFSQRTLKDIQSGDPDVALKALRGLVVSHNGWRDFDGTPYPPPDDPAFWEGDRAVTADLLACIVDAITEAINASPLARRRPPASASGSAPGTSGG